MPDDVVIDLAYDAAAEPGLWWRREQARGRLNPVSAADRRRDWAYRTACRALVQTDAASRAE